MATGDGLPLKAGKLLGLLQHLVQGKWSALGERAHGQGQGQGSGQNVASKLAGKRQTRSPAPAPSLPSYWPFSVSNSKFCWQYKSILHQQKDNRPPGNWKQQLRMGMKLEMGLETGMKMEKSCQRPEPLYQELGFTQLHSHPIFFNLMAPRVELSSVWVWSVCKPLIVLSVPKV